VNGYFDAPTARALRRYQLHLRLAADEVAGPATFTALGLQTRVPVRAQRSLAARTTSTTYVVKPGDSLTAIARAHHLTLAALARANRLNPNRVLLIGTRLRVPQVVHLLRTAAIAATDASAVRSSIDRWAATYGVDPHLARAVAWMESGFQQNVRSAVGAEGVMQLLPSTWHYVETVLIGTKVPHTADGNVRVGVAYLHHLLQAFGGNERLALAAWYQGEAAVRTHGVYKVSKPFVADVLALRARM
jgi:soluble lytic murein transglycosylase-like protein